MFVNLMTWQLVSMKTLALGGRLSSEMIYGANSNNCPMHAKAGLRVVLKWKIYRPDSVIAAVIPLKDLL